VFKSRLDLIGSQKQNNLKINVKMPGLNKSPTGKKTKKRTKVVLASKKETKINALSKRVHRRKREYLGLLMFRLLEASKLKDMIRNTVLILTLISLIGNGFYACEAAVAASHSHSHRHAAGREREEDGAFSPRVHDREKIEPGFGHAEHHTEFDHEAILGSAKEAEEYDHLPPEEARKRLRALVEKMDLDGDKSIEKPELKAWILRSFRMLSEEESKERLQEVDANEDGLVSWQEYVEETFGINADQLNIPLQDLEEQRMMADDKGLFQAADKNNDGVLDQKEYVSFSHPEEDPSMLPIVYQQTLVSKDTDGDGQISFKEYIGDRGIDKGKEWLESEKNKFDDDLDKDKDGLLNRQEILSWVIPSNEEIADDEVAHLFAASDDDQDEKLSYDEILDHHETFVGSEATDYGDHLMNLDRFKEEL
jgi:Ca2+-binding EF-hand superfamily protein